MSYVLKYDDHLEMVVLTLEGVFLFEDYKSAWYDALDLILEKKCKRFLIDAYKHKEIPVSNQVWFIEDFLQEAHIKLPKDVKIARIGSRYFENESGIKQIYRYIKKQNYSFNIRGFKEYMDATDWLLENVY